MTNFMDDPLNSFLIFVEKTYLKSGCLSIPTVSYIGQSFFKLYKGWCRKAVCACPCYTKSYSHIVVTCTGKSLSEALIDGSTNPQYDKRLFVDLPVQYMKTTSSEHGENMLCA